MHSALGASIYRFSNDGPYFEAEIVDPQKSSPNGIFVATLFFFFCPPSFCCGL